MAEDELDDDAFVVRFGLMGLEDLRDAAARCFNVLGFHGLSFYGENLLTPEEIAALAKKPHTYMRKTRVGRLREAGLDVHRRGRFPHLSLEFAKAPTDEELEKLAGMFDEPEANPHPVE